MTLAPIELRPGVINPDRWHGAGRKRAVSDRVRKLVLERDNFTCAGCQHRALKWMHIHHVRDEESDELSNLATICPACHAVLHFGRSLQVGAIEIWKCLIPQVEIVRRTREGIRKGLQLAEINSTFGLARGRFAPDSMRWPNDLLADMGTHPQARLPEPLCAVFVNFRQWQLEVP